MLKKVTIVIIILLVCGVGILGFALYKKSQSAGSSVFNNTPQASQSQSNQGGPDTPGQPAAPESGAPGAAAGANN